MPIDYQNPWIDAAVVVATAIAVCLCVLLHYETLSWMSRWLVRLRHQKRRRVLFCIFGVLSVHIAEIWIFGIAFAVLLLWPDMGAVQGISGNVLDQVYVSAMTFTTVGTSGVVVNGPVRFLAGTEALAGLVLITWSASFTYLEMQRFWPDRER
jgi:hypothetical protein